MQIAVVGTGVVGQTLGSKLVDLGHDVKMGSRTAGNDKAVTWARQYDERASEGSFADAAAFGELVINATAGMVSVEALRAAGADNLAGKVLVDVSNAMDFSAGFPPRLGVPPGDSVGEQLQREFPAARVVKALNTVTAAVMVHPERVAGEHNIFVAGEDDRAKRQTADLLQAFGWPEESIVDLGGIVASRGLEAYLFFWLTLMQSEGTPIFNIKVVR